MAIDALTDVLGQMEVGAERKIDDFNLIEPDADIVVVTLEVCTVCQILIFFKGSSWLERSVDGA